MFGILFAVLVPPFGGYDEPLHFLRAWQVGDGHLVSVDDRSSTAALATDRDELGGRFPDELRTDIIDLIEEGVFSTDASFSDLYSHLNDRVARGERVFIAYPSAAVYSPIPYLPSAIVIDIARVLHLSTLATFLLARLAGLGAYIGLVALAIRRLPQRKWILATLGLAPIVVFQAATVTADTFTVALAVLLLADALRMASLRRGDGPDRSRRRDRRRHGRPRVVQTAVRPRGGVPAAPDLASPRTGRDRARRAASSWP